ncbi:IS66 family insertion sequence element accessory protein TnpA [Sunxiuqinia dokdonensis]|uniref:Uncharacterized protein n=1 Tax=Sunxiuqinia dokdonensis TaxID=1409788 RepID=A0A0L8VCM6_9BACT|nr:hypothetical protein [Sunxiuqinia dokdonensis]KOH45947.1 hypothetical protein NC99_12350 [Sunxiuqinia dokdonensis]
MNTQEKTEQMYALVDRRQQSGLSQTAFAQEEGVNLHTLRYWISKRDKEDVGSGGFIQLGAVTGTSISLRYPNGVELLLPSTIPVATLKGLVNL